MGTGLDAAIRPRMIWLALGVAMVLAAASLYAGEAEPTLLTEELSTWRLQAQPTEAATCSLKNHVPTAMSYYSHIEAGDRFASFMNPAHCSGSPDYPYAIYFVSLPLFHFTGVHWPVGVKVEVWNVPSGDSCAGPDTLLYSRHFLLDSASFMAPHVGTIKLPDPVCVTGPFFIAIEYDGTTPAPYPSVLFDTICPTAPCVNWGYHRGWAEWTEFWTGPIAGNFMVWVDGYSNSSYCQCDETVAMTVESAHDQRDTLQGSRVSILGYYTGQPDNKFVSRITDFVQNEPMPARSEMILLGPPPSDSMAGAYAALTGYVQVERDPRRVYPSDTVTMRIYPSKITKILPGPTLVVPSGAMATSAITPDATCDSCSFAVLIGGGANEANNHARFWEELSAQYVHATTAGGYCASNMFVLYYDGFARDGSVPQASIDSCTPGRIQARLDDISHRVASCARRGKLPSLELFITGHGRAAGLITLRDSTITGTQLRTWLQRAIDSSLSNLEVTMNQAYAGAMADSLKSLNNLKRTSIGVSSAGGDESTLSPADGSRFARARIEALNLGDTRPVATARAADAYLAYLDSLENDYENWSEQIRSWLAGHPPVAGDSARPKLVQDSIALRLSTARISAIVADTSSRPNLWSRLQLQKFCEWYQLAAPSGGQFELQFTGDAAMSGSVTTYMDTILPAGSAKVKSSVWHWNISGSAGFAVGNEKRIKNGASSNVASLWVHSDNLEATVTATLRTTCPDVEAASNPYAFPGFSIGGTDKSNAEFGSSLGASVAVSGVELPGLKLSDMPGLWGGCGTSQLTAEYSVPALTPWHDRMEFRLEVLQVMTAGTVSFQISGAEHSTGSFAVSMPGTYRFDCGSFTQTGANQVAITVPSGCFAIDSWALRSASLDPLTCCIGTTGNVNGAGIVDLSDLSMLIAYLTASPRPVLSCPDEANVNTLGIIDLSDLSMLIAYLLGQRSSLPACP